MLDKSVLRQFLGEVLDMVPEEQALLLFYINKKTQEKLPFFVTDASAGLDYCERHQEWNSYYGVATRAVQKRPRPYWRGTEQDVLALLEVHADVDILSAAHTKANLPPTKDDARLLVEDLPLRPSMLVDTGNGLQSCLWLKEAESVTTPEERSIARDAVKRYQNAVLSNARRLGNWTIDSTFNLDRVLRLPGTINWNGDEPRLCTIIYDNGPRYPSLSAFFEEFPALPDDTQASDERKAEAAQFSKGLVFSPHFFTNAMFDKLLESSLTFNKTWRKERTDIQDLSQSGHDMALVHFLLRNGFSFQVALSAMMIFREKHKAKPVKESYYLRTLQRAWLHIQTMLTERKAAEETQAQLAAEVQTEAREARREEEKEKPEVVYRDAERFFEFPTGYTILAITKVISLRGAREISTLEILIRTPEGVVKEVELIGDMRFELKRIRSAIEHVTSYAMRVNKKREELWLNDLYNRITTVCPIHEEEGANMTEAIRQKLEEWTVEAISCYESVDKHGFHSALYDHQSFIDEHNSLCFSFERFMKQLNDSSLFRHVTSDECSNALRKLRGEKDQRTFEFRGKKVTRRFWRVPWESLSQSYERPVALEDEPPAAPQDNDTARTIH